MKKSLQVIKSTKNVLSGSMYRMTVRQNGSYIANLQLNLNKQNNYQINNVLKDVLQNQQYNILRQENKIIFEGIFEQFKIFVDNVTTYYPDVGLLVYDVQTEKLILHTTKEDIACQGIVIGYVNDCAAASFLATLSPSNAPMQILLENSYNYYLKKTLNISLAVSLLVLYNQFSGSKTQFGVFERNEKEHIQKK